MHIQNERHEKVILMNAQKGGGVMISLGRLSRNHQENAGKTFTQTTKKTIRTKNSKSSVLWSKYGTELWK